MSAHSWRNRGLFEKSRFIGLAGGYHGETVGALSVTDIPLFREAYAPLVRLGATVPSPDARTARGFLHSHSYTGNPLACRAALAVLDLFADEPVLARNRDTAARLSTLCEPLDRHAKVRHARRLGMLWAWDIDSADPAFSSRFHQAALRQGLLLRPIGSTLYFLPPYVFDVAALQQLVAGSLRALDEVMA